jgi:pilus assembly protein CpaE
MLKPFLSKSSSPDTQATHAITKIRHPVTTAAPGDNALAGREIGAGSDIRATKNPIIGVIGAKGGVGATTLSINLALAIAAEYGAVTLVDGNLQQPDAAVLLGRASDFTVLDLIERTEELNSEMVQACSVPVSNLVPGCRLVSPPADGGAAIKTDLSTLANCLNKMRSCSPTWLIDLPKHLDRHLVTMMDDCDLIVLVTEPTLPSVNASKRWSKIFADLGYPPGKICLALNRAGGKITLVEDQLRHLGASQDMYIIPNAYELSERSITRGEPVVTSHPRAPLSLALKKLAAGIMERCRNV